MVSQQELDALRRAYPDLPWASRADPSSASRALEETAMMRSSARQLGSRVRGSLVVVALLAGLVWGLDYSLDAEELQTSIDNNHPIRNPGGHSATFSTRGFVDLTGEYFQAQGTNGRSCASCHIPAEAWSINPGTLKRLFDETGGAHPVFNVLDANNPNMDVSTVEARRVAYSMLLSHGVFRRGGALRAEREWDLIAVEDPHGFANTTRLVQWRRVMPTINFPLGSATVNWDGGNSVVVEGQLNQRAGLENQARRNVTGAQQGAPASDQTIADIVDFEVSLFTAQLIVPGVGRLDSDGARGGPEALSVMPKMAGRFDLFDAWANHENPRRRQIARGQELFNTLNAGGRSCVACHNSANNGTNINNLLFDIRTASAEARTPDLPLYTFRNRTTGEIRQLTDSGRGNVTGLWNDLGRFKTPTLRGLAARAPYFHNGIAATLEDVVRHYEAHLGFIFTDEERAALVAFLNAL
jgi:cytochrome c peroxidase